MSDISEYGTDPHSHEEHEGFAENPVQVALDAGRMMAQPVVLDTGKIHLARTRHGVTTIDLTGDEYRDTPRRATGHPKVYNVPSFLTYFDKHSTDASEVYACPQSHVITAVLNAHGGDGRSAGWGDHRVSYPLTHTPMWKAWDGNDGRWLDQEQFAEFIEANRAGVVEPDAATLMEIVQTFQANTKVTFKSGIQTQSGQKVLQYAEDTTATAGANGKLTIPATLVLGLPVFVGATARHRVGARLQFRVTGGRLTMRYLLEDKDIVVQGAFDEVVAQIDSHMATEDSSPVIMGTPSR